MKLSAAVAVLLASTAALAQGKPITSYSCTTQLLGLSRAPVPPAFVRTVEATRANPDGVDVAEPELALRLNGRAVVGDVRVDAAVKQHAGRDFLEVRFGPDEHWFIVLYRPLEAGMNRGVLATVHQWVPFGLGMFPYVAALGTAQCDVEIEALAPTELPSYGF